MKFIIISKLKLNFFLFLNNMDQVKSNLQYREKFDKKEKFCRLRIGALQACLIKN